MYCIANRPAPLLNTPDFQGIFGGETLLLDNQGLLRCLEMIALPETKFQILEELPHQVYKVTTHDYPHGPQYIDARFVTSAEKSSPEREKILPPKETILFRLEKSLGLPYIWGGNWGKGIPEILSFYQPKIPPHFAPLWTLAGVDCSGLLYEATEGYTPRNTSALIHFGEIVPSLENVKPLDILIWPGHVVIFLTPTLLIESLCGKGVISTTLAARLPELSLQKFVIRRFYPS